MVPAPRPRTPDLQHRTLADFLRTHRARVSPAARGRRRTPGLRREEVAQLAGISATWYTWMEQGRDVSVSPATLDHLAKALQLTAAERTYLFELAGKRDPAAVPTTITESPTALSDAIAAISTPAYGLDRLWNAVAWNKAAAKLFVGWLDGDHDRNQLRYVFRSPAARRLIGDWNDRARRVLAEFRADTAKGMGDLALQALVDELRGASPLFATAWDEHMVVSREGGERTFNHPVDGKRVFRQATFTFAARPEFKMVILTPVKKPTTRTSAQ